MVSVLGATGFPQPPVDLPLPLQPQAIITGVLGLVSVALVAVGFVEWRRSGSPLMLLGTVGGLLTSLNEPIFDIMARVWFADDGGQWTAFEAYGRPIPVWLPMAYLAFFGAAPYLLAQFFRRGFNVRRWWGCIAVLIALNSVMEMPLLIADLYVYYGDQPFSVFGFPMYMACLNMVGVMTTSVVLLRFGHLLTGARALSLVPLPVVGQMASAAFGLPVFNAANAGVTGPALWACAIVTFGACATAYHFLGRAALASVPATGRGVADNAGESAAVPAPLL